MTNLYSVSYNTNNSTGGTTPPTQSATSDSTSYTFRAPTAEEYGLARTGYTFMGWSENPNAPIQEYDGGDTIELNSTSPQKILYAMWGKEYNINFSRGDALLGSAPTTPEKVLIANLPYTYTPKTAAAAIYKPGYTGGGWNEVTFTVNNPSPTATPTWRAVYGGITTMQDMTPSICSNATQHDPTILTDSRDNKYYWVDKLKDHNCWMTQNLDYDDPNSNKVTSTSGTNGGPASGDWQSDDSRRQYWDPGEKVVNSSTLANATSSTDRHLLVGNYYSWASATNGTAPSSAGEASGSVCPEGWRLPSNNSSKGPTFAGLQTAYSIGSTGSKFLDSPLHFLYGGNIGGGGLNSAGSYGYYWSSTSNSSTDAYLLSFNSGSVNPSNNYNRSIGRSVRCVAR